MQKRGLILGFFLFLFVINFVSATFHYGGSSLSDLLNSFDSSTVILTSIFLIAFILIFWPLSKFFRENALLAGIISFAISFLLIFEINRRGYNFIGFFYGIGLSEGILSTIIPLVLIIGLIFSAFKYGLGITLTSLGGFLIIISFTDIIYEKGITFILGAILLGIGIWLWWRKRRGPIGSNYGGYYDTPSGPSQRQIYKQQRTQQKQQQNLENQRRREEQRQQQLMQKTTEQQQRAQQKQQQKLENQRRGEELTQQKHQENLAERERQAHETEVRTRAKKIEKIRTRREKAARQEMERREKK